MKKSQERCTPKKGRKDLPVTNMTKLTSPNNEALVLIHALLGLRNRILNICQSGSTNGNGSTTQDDVFRWMISSQDERIRQCHHTNHLKNAIDAFRTHILTSRSPRSQVWYTTFIV